MHFRVNTHRTKSTARKKARDETLHARRRTRGREKDSKTTVTVDTALCCLVLNLYKVGG